MDSALLANLAIYGLVPAVATIVSIRVGLNGTRERVQRIEDKLDKSLETQSAHGERLATVEAKIR
jgi:hypothetical protein